MRRTIFCVLAVLVIGIIGSHVLMAVPQVEGEEDNYGKVIGQVIDAESGEPVNEAFQLIFYDHRGAEFIKQYVETDTHGHFIEELFPYIYYVGLSPLSNNSKYCKPPSPFKLNEEKRHIVKIEKGKITEIQLKAFLGGSIRIYTADMSNTRFNPQEKFNLEFSIHTLLTSSIYESVDSGRDDLNDGELFVNKLHPGLYTIRVSFRGLGYQSIKKENILVEKGKTTEVLINIDLNDNTGIEGIITDANGVALEDAGIGLSPIDQLIKGDFGVKTNKNGYFILKGMPEGYYHLSYEYYRKGVDLISFPGQGIIEIKKNVLKRLDIQLKYTKDELENESK